MQTNSVPPVLGQPPPVRKKRRWWLYVLLGVGCLVVLGIAVVVLIAGYFNSVVNNYTEAQPKTLAKVDASPAAQEQLKARWVYFQQSVTAGRNTRPFKLSADDLNVFLANNPQLKDRVRFRIEGNRLLADFTMPLDQTRQPKLQGRHLNGLATLNLKFADGFLTLSVAELEANGKPVSRSLLGRALLGKLQQENLLKFLDNNREVMDFLQRIDTVEISEGFVVLTPMEGR